MTDARLALSVTLAGLLLIAAAPVRHAAAQPTTSRRPVAVDPRPVPTPIAPPGAPEPTQVVPSVPPMPTPTSPVAPAPGLVAAPPAAEAGADAGVPAAQTDGGVAQGDAAVVAVPRTPPLPEEHRPRLEISVDPRDGLHTGDMTTLRLTVHAAPGDDITLPEDQRFGARTSTVTPDPIELLDSRVRVEPRADQGRDFHFELDLLLLEPGEHEVGPLRVRVLTAAGQVGVVEADVQRLSVASVLGNEPDAQPFPPSEPVSVMEEDDRPYWVLGALGVLLLGLLLGYLLRRYLQKRAQAPKPAPPPLPPWDIAAGELSWLAQTRRQHIDDGKWDEWVDKLSDVLRGYLGARYEFDGLECTTGEIVTHLRTRKTDPRLVKRVEELLDACDLVKFANSPAGDEETDQMLATALNMVRETRPVVGGVAAPMPASPVAIPIPATRMGPARVKRPPATDANPDARWMPRSADEDASADAGVDSDANVDSDADAEAEAHGAGEPVTPPNSDPAHADELRPEDEILPVPRRIVAKVIPLTNVGDDGRTRMEPFPLGAMAGVDDSVPTLPGFADDEAADLARKAREAREAAQAAAVAAAAAEAAAEAAAAAARAARATAGYGTQVSGGTDPQAATTTAPGPADVADASVDSTSSDEPGEPDKGGGA